MSGSFHISDSFGEEGEVRSSMEEFIESGADEFRVPEGIGGYKGSTVSKGKRRGVGETGIDWDTVRRHYVVGKREQLEDGSWVSTNISLSYLAEYYDIKYSVIKSKSVLENWKKYRKAYLARVTEKDTGKDLSFYVEENLGNELSAMNSAQKLSRVADIYIEHKYRKVLAIANDLNKSGKEIDEEVDAELSKVNNATGMSVFVNELSNAVKVVKDIYTLQRQIYDNVPKEEVSIIDEMTAAKTARSEREKQKRLEDLKRQVLSIKGGSSYYTEMKDGSNTAKAIDYELVEVLDAHI